MVRKHHFSVSANEINIKKETQKETNQYHHLKNLSSKIHNNTTTS